ncbi:multicopper oxidase [Gigaspora margarita]|uniref:Multicopper oxidase n=1 Tax=Gigaspora margarita TaxID=4874 RepID=A0A8H4ET40_GIGMA|nr:multicopper oxidase [Gigaspora margarita]
MDNLNRLNKCIDLNTSDLKPFFPENVLAKADQTIYFNVSIEKDASNVYRGVVNGSTYAVDVNNPTINQILFKTKLYFNQIKMLLVNLIFPKLLILWYIMVLLENIHFICMVTRSGTWSGPVDTKPDF